MNLKARNDIHLARRLWHFFGVMSIFCLFWFLPLPFAKALALGFSGFMIGFDVFRLRVPAMNRIFIKLFRPFLREGEHTRVSGAASMMAGVTIIVWFFPRPVTAMALLFLAIADPLASYFGIRFGRDKLIGHKSFQGTLAAFIACFFIALGFLLWQDLMRERLFLVCLLSALVGAASELVPVGRLDDNFVFPVVSAGLLHGLLYVFGGL